MLRVSNRVFWAGVAIVCTSIASNIASSKQESKEPPTLTDMILKASEEEKPLRVEKIITSEIELVARDGTSRGKILTTPKGSSISLTSGTGSIAMMSADNAGMLTAQGKGTFAVVGAGMISPSGKNPEAFLNTFDSRGGRIFPPSK